MKSKTKELINKEEGFTLIELLAVIVILGVVLTIAVPAVGNVVNKSQEKADEAEIALIEDAARIYFTADEEGINRVKNTTNENPAMVDLLELVRKGYLDDRSKDEDTPLTEKYEGTSRVIMDENGMLELIGIKEKKY